MKRIILLLIIIPQFSYGMTVQELKTFCESPQIGDNFLCLGYIQGHHDTMYDFISTPVFNASRKCLLVQRTSWGQVQDIFLKWARNNPENYQWNASQGLTVSFTNAFCASK